MSEENEKESTKKIKLEEEDEKEKTKEIKLDEEEDVCCICLEEKPTDLVISCGHKFHKECLTKWSKINYHCPLCKSPVITFKKSPNNHRNANLIVCWQWHDLCTILKEKGISLKARCCDENLEKTVSIIVSSIDSGFFIERYHDKSSCHEKILSLLKLEGKKACHRFVIRNDSHMTIEPDEKNELTKEQCEFTGIFGPWYEKDFQHNFE